MTWRIGVIGGSGLYSMPELEDVRQLSIDTPFGMPSEQPIAGRLHEIDFVFLPRHGHGHRIPPDAINARANIDVLKRAGVTDILAVSSVGSLREELAPGHFVVVDQFIDRTRGRAASFFETGLVAHVSLADPTCSRLSGLAADAVRAAGVTVTPGATYLAMEGPQFSTRAESRLYRQWGCDVIGMTAMPEARLAREAELPYALVAMVTDFDCWRDDCAPVDVADVIATMRTNAAGAGRMLLALAQALPAERPPSSIDTVLDTALITSPSKRDPAVIARLDAILARVLR